MSSGPSTMCLGCGRALVKDPTRELCTLCSAREQSGECLKCHTNKKANSYVVCAECLHNVFEKNGTQTVFCGGCGRTTIKDDSDASPLCAHCEKHFEEEKRRKCARCGKEGDFNGCYFCPACLDCFKREVDFVAQGVVFRMRPPERSAPTPTPDPRPDPRTDPGPGPRPGPRPSPVPHDKIERWLAWDEDFLRRAMSRFDNRSFGQEVIWNEHFKRRRAIVDQCGVDGIEVFTRKLKLDLFETIRRLYTRAIYNFFEICGMTKDVRDLYKEYTDGIRGFDPEGYLTSGPDLILDDLDAFENNICKRVFEITLCRRMDSYSNDLVDLFCDRGDRNLFKDIWDRFSRVYDFYHDNELGWRLYTSKDVFARFEQEHSAFVDEVKRLIYDLDGRKRSLGDSSEF